MCRLTESDIIEVQSSNHRHKLLTDERNSQTGFAQHRASLFPYDLSDRAGFVLYGIFRMFFTKYESWKEEIRPITYRFIMELANDSLISEFSFRQNHFFNFGFQPQSDAAGIVFDSMTLHYSVSSLI